MKKKYTLKQLVKKLHPHLEEDEQLTLYLAILKRKSRGVPIWEAILKPIGKREARALSKE